MTPALHPCSWFTGMGQARTVINVPSTDVVVVCGDGGAGTASAAAHA